MSTPLDQVDEFIQGNEDPQSAVGKYLLIDVPDYNKGDLEGALDDNGIPKDNNKMRTFLRMGSAPLSWTTEPGADLVKLAYQVGPAGKEADPKVIKRFAKASSVTNPNPEFDAAFAMNVVIDEKYTTEGSTSYDPELVTIAEAAKLAKQKEIDAAVAAGKDPPEFSDVELFPPFIDDQRSRGKGNKNVAGPEGHGLTAEERAQVSAKLHTRGGWRDHTEGNRITTTRGDKIEVVEGNYKLIVMGRQTDAGQGMGWEATGNNVQDFAGATMPGASVTVTWIKEAYNESISDKEYKGGAWLLQNSTERVYQYSRNAGNFKEENWGDLRESYIGSENPRRVGTAEKDGTQGHPSEHTLDPSPKPETAMPSVSSVGLPRGNPRIIEKRWSVKIESYTGSKAWWIPEMHTELWAKLNKELTHVDTADKESWFKTSREVTHADSTVEEFHVSGELKEEIHAGSINAKTHAGTLTEFTHVKGLARSETKAASILDLTFTGAKTDITIAANQFELSAGIHESIELAAVLDIFIGLKLEISAALATEINVGGRVAINCASSTEINSGPKLTVDLAGVTELSTVQNFIGGIYKMMGANVQIG